MDAGAALKPVRRLEVLKGMTGRRRTWTLEEKLALVAEMERSGNIAAFSREHDVSTSMLYTWRREWLYAVEARRCRHTRTLCSYRFWKRRRHQRVRQPMAASSWIPTPSSDQSGPWPSIRWLE